MELRSEKAAAGVVAALLIGPALWGAATYPARHDHTRKGCTGTLTAGDQGLSYEENAAARRKKRKHPHRWNWAYGDIQQLEISPKRMRVLTYRDNKWKLGADREFTFDALSGANFTSAYSMLKDRLDQRFVAAVDDATVKPLWELPVKHLARISGSEGVLVFGRDRIVYRTDKKGEARTWRYSDIDNIGTSGPFSLTLTTFERAKTHYGSRKDFNFQLKQRLEEARYNDLWRRINVPEQRASGTAAGRQP